jgi:hypothetical protein
LLCSEHYTKEIFLWINAKLLLATKIVSKHVEYLYFPSLVLWQLTTAHDDEGTIRTDNSIDHAKPHTQSARHLRNLSTVLFRIEIWYQWNLGHEGANRYCRRERVTTVLQVTC